MFKGLDILGLAKHDIKMLIANWQPNTALGCLFSTFGNPMGHLNKLIGTGKVPAVRVHLSNGSCARSGTCEPNNEIMAGDLKGLASRAAHIQILAEKYTGVKFYLSPRLEHDEKNLDLVKSWVTTIQKSAPSCTPVISYASGVTIQGIPVERHGNAANADIISNDGESLSDADAGYINGGNLISFGWLNVFNGRGSSSNDPWTPPSKRKADWFATANDIKYCNYWLSGKESTPNIPEALAIKAPEILKPFAEYYTTVTDTREKKPVFLCSRKVPSWSIRTLAGKEICKALIFEPPDGALHRYYSQMDSATIVQKAGSQWVLYVAGKVTYLVNVIFRQGQMR